MPQSTVPANVPAVPRKAKYFKVHLSLWTNFDPSSSTSAQITSAIEDGSGLVTVIEVTESVERLEDINDVEVREHFVNLLAVNRVLQNWEYLPSKLKEKLFSTLGLNEAA
jgi:hypothetical protein